MGPLDILLQTISNFLFGDGKSAARRWLERFAMLCFVVILAFLVLSLFQ
jgi:hypothetical protein